MAPSTIRWAIGAMKDQTSIGLAKIKSSIAPDMDIAIVKATSHDDDAAHEKHIQEILSLTSSSRPYIAACVATVSKRLSRTRDWIVALKSLILLHRLLADGDPYFHHQILHSTTRRGTRLLNLSDFQDENHSNSWDESTFVRAYSLYLDQRLQCMLFELKQSSGGEGGRREDCSSQPRSLSYRESEDYCRRGDPNYRPPNSNYREFDSNSQDLEDYRRRGDPNYRPSNSNYREFDSCRDLNSRYSDSNDRESKFYGGRDPNWQSPNSSYGQLDSNRVLNSRFSDSNYRESKFCSGKDSNYREFDSRHSGSNYRESKFYGGKDPNWRSPNSNYREFNSYNSNDDAPTEQQRPMTPLRDMKIDRVLRRLQQLQLLLDRLLVCRPIGTAKNTHLVLAAIYPVVKESFHLYANICEVLVILLERFFDMDYPDCVKAFESYQWAAKQIDELISFYAWCKEIGAVRSSEYPEVQRVSDKILETLEEFMRDRARNPNSPKKEMERAIAREEEEDPMPIKALPAPENYNEKETTENSAVTEQHPQQQESEADLLNLKEDAISADDQSNKFALALFSESGSSSNSNIGGSWKAVPTESKADWELALVESTSNLTKQKATMAGGFDSLLLSGMYDHGSTRQYSRGGSESSMALPGPGSTSVLALPWLEQDPFAASLSIPPPSYVQMADMEKKQRLVVEEQQVWEQYKRDGMQGQGSLGRMSAYGVGPPVAVATPYAMPSVYGGGTYYYYSSN